MSRAHRSAGRKRKGGREVSEKASGAKGGRQTRRPVGSEKEGGNKTKSEEASGAKGGRQRRGWEVGSGGRIVASGPY